MLTVIDRDHRRRLIERLACLTMFCLFAIVLPRATVPTASGNTHRPAAVEGAPAEALQTRRYRFKLLPLESGDRYILLA